MPKPARESGLKPSGLPAAKQLNIAAEQPSIQASYEDMYTSGPSREQYNDMQHAYNYTRTYFTQPQFIGTQFIQPQPPYNNHFMQPELFPDGNNNDNDNDGISIYKGNTYGQGQFSSMGDQLYTLSSTRN
ncbi:uncharacterized protein EDB91DRAFT_1247682 [Suillus paluster]|uniref:uncharacterized protein n=1 Tax=Suillus paluster TaxID=48578 RepID=UPI001B87B11C|nr:uncharacterized protein EDB91DRAFT_1258819 [Suillus paluster]XP_041177921.1 uncharacterized protein EDB91DRAFT_1247682 [Suillus paluster]KAG1718173.1 hypothetical protein EDB91DRAFT_1258819 [Suillus paluster]KAG1742281.1 hypothetical protein EDB91DRAFT_1247682 [Suillus paluster]